MAEQRTGRRLQLPALPVRTRLVLAMMLLALAPQLLIGYLQLNEIERVVTRLLATDSEAVARERATQLSLEVDRLQGVARSLAAAQVTRFVGASATQREEYLINSMTDSPTIRRLMLIERDGAVTAAAPNFLRTPVALPEEVLQGTFTTRIVTDNPAGAEYQVFVPIGLRENVRSVLFMSVDIGKLLGQSPVPRASDGAAFLLAGVDGRVVYSTQGDMLAAVKGIDAGQEPIVAAAQRGEVSAAWSTGTLGDFFMAAAPARAGEATWTLIYTLPRERALATVTELRNNLMQGLLYVTLTVALVVVAVALVLSRQLLAPVLSVVNIMARVRSGDLRARVPWTRRDELGALGADLNQTLDSLVALVQTREERDALQRSITRLLDEVSEVAGGDLTVQAQVTADQIGAVADAFNYMIDELRALVERTQTTADQVSASALEVTTLTDRMVVSAEEQARRLDGARQSVTQMTELMRDVRAAVDQSVSAADQARVAVLAGQEAVTQNLDAMGRLRSETRETAGKIKRLGESSQEIGEIVRLIDEIADQTHLLALNASIQAAMAGEHGRGFAVVAEEVRALAERSAAATDKIEQLISAIQADTNAAMVAMEQSTQEVVSSSRLADKAGAALADIGAVTDRIVELSKRIEELVDGQVVAAQSLEGTVTDVAVATLQASDEVKAVATGMQALRDLATSLRESVSVFRVTPAEASEEENAAVDEEPAAA